MRTESITEPTVTKRDIVRLTVNMIPVDFYVEDIIDGIPQISILQPYLNNVEYTEYGLGATQPLRPGQEYEKVRPRNN
jgi:hypothetical protein